MKCGTMERDKVKRCRLRLSTTILLTSTLGACAQPPDNPLEALKLEDLAATRDRPVFAPTRRPPPPRVEVAPAPPPAPPAEMVAVDAPPPFDLVGAAVGSRSSFVLLRDRGTYEVTRLRSGEEAQGWRVGAIGARSVMLERNGRAQSLAIANPSTATTATEVAGARPVYVGVAAPADESRRLAGRARPDR